MDFIQAQGATAVILPLSSCRNPYEYDRELYRHRNLIELAFNKLKHWRRIVTRNDRRGIYFLSALYLVASVIRSWRMSIRPNQMGWYLS